VRGRDDQAEAFALHFAAKRIDERYQAIVEQLRGSDLSNLADFHSTTSGLKAWCTWATQDGIETCRRSCGGHGCVRPPLPGDCHSHYVRTDTR
jgi:acyl-CoA oxidase